MRKKKRKYVFVFLLLVIFILASLTFLFYYTVKEPVEEGLIPEKEVLAENKTEPVIPDYDVGFMVLQGDIVILPFGKEMALIGVKAPEKNEPYFKESINKLGSLVIGKNISLYKDVKDMNSYGRYSRYVFIDDVFVNEAMLRSGLAKFVSEPPNTKYDDLLYEAQVDAITKRLYLWKDLEADPCLFVAFFNYDAYGVDEYNLNEEFVTFRNICKAKIDMTGWTVQDSTEMYTFLEFVLGPEAAVTLHSGQGNDSELHLYWNNEVSVWNDESDTLYLRNPSGNVIIRKHY